MPEPSAPASAARPAPPPEHLPAAALTRQRLGALFAAGLMLLNFPLLGLWERPVTVLGLPLFPLALFTLWAVLIVLLAWLLESAAD